MTQCLKLDIIRLLFIWVIIYFGVETNSHYLHVAIFSCSDFELVGYTIPVIYKRSPNGRLDGKLSEAKFGVCSEVKSPRR